MRLPLATAHNLQPAAPKPCPASEFEVDFVTISYCRSAEDVFEAREFLAAIGQEHTKVSFDPRFRSYIELAL